MEMTKEKKTEERPAEKKAFSARALLPYLLFAAALLAVDQGTKYWAQHYLQLQREIPVIEGIFSFTYVQNYGAAFGMLSGQRWILLLLTCGILIGGVWLVVRYRITQPALLLSGTAVFAGAIGNLVDRIRLSYVVDFLEVRFFSFPVFNLADCFVVVGMAMLAILIVRGADS